VFLLESWRIKIGLIIKKLSLGLLILKLRHLCSIQDCCHCTTIVMR